MTYYRAYLLDGDHHIISVAKFHCVDEQAARDCTKELVDANDMELWKLDRCIAVFEASTAKCDARRR